MKVSELFESISDKLKSLDVEIDRYLDAGEIVKPEFERLKQAIDHAIRREVEPRARWYHGRGAELDAVGDDALSALPYAVPNSSSEVLSLKSKLSRVKAKDHPFFKELDDVYRDYSPIALKLKALKDKIVTTAKKREEVKAKKEVEYRRKFTDAEELVKILTADIDGCMKRASERAAEQYESCIKEFEKHDWDLDEVAPTPTAGIGRAAYIAMANKREFLSSLTVATRSGPGKNIRAYSAERKKALMDEASQDAHDNYMAWVAKIIDKIGKVVQTAEMSGNPWTGSTLSVVTQDGEKQVWHTKMIINASKYGKLFNQFPSRRDK